MAVVLDPPDQLEFNRISSPHTLRLVPGRADFDIGPFTVQVGRSLKVKNVDELPIAYKVKTTAPRRYAQPPLPVSNRSYCVRPNSGRIEPGHEVEVHGQPQSNCLLMVVLLQAMKVDPPLDIPCKDKFLLQTTAIRPEDEGLLLPELVSSRLVSIDFVSGPA
jgi:MSP (Major sperm protein) domain